VRDLDVSYDGAFRRLRRPRFDLDDYVRRRLDGRHAVYIEDPWGKIQFDMPEEFTASLESLIKRVAASEARLIITSRSSIFSQLAEFLGGDFAVTLRAEMVYGGRPPSYDDERKRRLLQNYHSVFHHDALPDSGAVTSVLSRLHSPNNIREFCYLTRHHDSPLECAEALDLSSDLDYQFSIELINDVQPQSRRRHRAALVLFLYVFEHARHLLQARPLSLADPSRGRQSFEEMYYAIVKDFPSLPLDPLRDALDALGDITSFRTPCIWMGSGVRSGTRACAG
jgi:hypothetical protein